ncbi:MAG TPA: hypothetical protein VFB32_03010 [Rudaea sp.]|nr:hypothetical protein [Rudaea sp.]
MLRLAGWLGIATLALCGYLWDSDACRIACAVTILALLAISAPPALRRVLACFALAGAAIAALRGADALVDAVPALAAGFVAWLFARTLQRGRLPLIARAIVAIDGPAQLEDPAVVRYARRLTLLWTVLQTALAAVAALLALRAQGLIALPLEAPSPRVFGAFVLPAAVVAVFLGEFHLRSTLLPQAPLHRLLPFVRAIVRAWPALLGE